MIEPRVIRERQAERTAEADRLLAAGEGGGLAILAQTTVVGQYPTVAGTCFVCVPLTIDGPETEGASPTFVADSSRRVYAYNLGTQVPPVNTKVIVHACGGRWTFRYDG